MLKKIVLFFSYLFFAIYTGGFCAGFIEGEAVARFSSGFPGREIKEKINAAGARIEGYEAKVGMVRVVSDTLGSMELVEELQRLDGLVYAVPNYIASSFNYRLPGDYGSIEDMRNNQWGAEKIGAHYAWALDTGTGTKVVVAVLDTGIDTGHQKLSGNIWQNPDPLDEINLGDEENPYIIRYDTHGWNFIDDSPHISTTAAHGTHVAGIIAAEEESTSGPVAGGVVGLNWGAGIMAVEVLDTDGSGTVWSVARGIVYAVRRGADIINMSLGFNPGVDIIPPLKEACRYAYSRGVLIIAAAGNDGGDAGYGGGICQPAVFSSVMAVAATDLNDRRADFSSYGRGVEIGAPGVDIKSTLPGDDYGRKPGTSMAAPFVSGAASLIISVWKDQGLSWTPEQVRQTLTSSAENSGRAWNRYKGYGRLDAGAALLQAAEIQSRSSEKSVLVYPNPFYPGRGQEVQIVLPPSSSASARRLRIYTADGVPVYDERIDKLPARWDGRNHNGRRCASGLYFFHIETESGGESGKITLIR